MAYNKKSKSVFKWVWNNYQTTNIVAVMSNCLNHFLCGVSLKKKTLFHCFVAFYMLLTSVLIEMTVKDSG